jgi:hypothetical protein
MPDFIVLRNYKTNNGLGTSIYISTACSQANKKEQYLKVDISVTFVCPLTEYPYLSIIVSLYPFSIVTTHQHVQ